MGDPLFIFLIITLFFLIYLKKYRELTVIAIFSFSLILIILNSNYWILPFSELLYPERSILFFFILIAFSGALVFENAANFHFTIKGNKIYFIKYIILIFMIVLGVTYKQRYLYCILQPSIQINQQTKESFIWIEKNTEKNALFKASYLDVGIWIPTFSNRATINTHIHFIHEIKHVFDTMEKESVPKYYFVTQRDSICRTLIFNEIKNCQLLYSNTSIKIFKR